MWVEFRPMPEKARTVAARDDAYMFNRILKLGENPEFAAVDATGAVPRRGRYETNAHSRITKAIRRAGLSVWPQAWYGIRDYRINELGRLDYREAENSVWFGNSEATQKLHYQRNSSDSRGPSEGSRCKA